MFEIRICVTQECNFLCDYCKAGGEGISNNNVALTKEQIKNFINKASNYGFTSVRITGGEPLLRDDVYEIILDIKSLDNIKNISIVTNGSLLTDETCRRLKKSGIDSVTVSLDSMNRTKFNSITGVNCFDKVVSNILNLKKYIDDVRINMVVMKSNVKEIPEMIRFCRINKIDLKLLDLNNTNENWENEYIALDNISELISAMGNSVTTRTVKGSTGTPMQIVNINGIDIITKDSRDGTTYSNVCLKCERYPCQTGISSPIMTHDGMIKLCTFADKKGENMFHITDVDLNNLKNIFENLERADKWHSFVPQI